MNVSARLGNRRLSLGQATEVLTVKRAVLVLVLITAAALFYAFTSVAGRNLSYAVTRESDTMRELSEVQRRLKVELGILQSHGRLERQGARQGLKPPAPDQIRVLR